MLSKSVVNAFVDCFSSREVLRTIDEFFNDMELTHDQATDDDAVARGEGQRRARARAYLSSLQLDDPDDVSTLLQAVGLKLGEWERTATTTYRADLDRLVRNLEIAGYAWDGSRLTRRIKPGSDVFSAKLAALESEDVDREVARIFAATDTDPADAITAARSLLETVCKHVLDELGESFDDSQELPALYKQTAKALKLDPTQHDAVYHQTLQGLVTTVYGLAAVRNKLGDAHGGRRGGARPRPRHARMAAGAAMTVATFLAETMAERRAQAPTAGT